MTVTQISYKDTIKRLFIRNVCVCARTHICVSYVCDFFLRVLFLAFFFFFFQLLAGKLLILENEMQEAFRVQFQVFGEFAAV